MAIDKKILSDLRKFVDGDDTDHALDAPQLHPDGEPGPNAPSELSQGTVAAPTEPKRENPKPPVKLTPPVRPPAANSGDEPYSSTDHGQSAKLAGGNRPMPNRGSTAAQPVGPAETTVGQSFDLPTRQNRLSSQSTSVSKRRRLQVGAGIAAVAATVIGLTLAYWLNDQTMQWANIATENSQTPDSQIAIGPTPPESDREPIAKENAPQAANYAQPEPTAGQEPDPAVAQLRALLSSSQLEAEQARNQAEQARIGVTRMQATLSRLREKVVAGDRKLQATERAMKRSEVDSVRNETKIRDLSKRLNQALLDKIDSFQNLRTDVFRKVRQNAPENLRSRVVGNRLVFHSEAMFAPGTARLSSSGRAALSTLTNAIGNELPETPNTTAWRLDIQVDDGTDSSHVHQALSATRAAAVANELKRRGIADDHVTATGGHRRQAGSPATGKNDAGRSAVVAIGLEEYTALEQELTGRIAELQTHLLETRAGVKRQEARNAELRRRLAGAQKALAARKPADSKPDGKLSQATKSRKPKPRPLAGKSDSAKSPEEDMAKEIALWRSVKDSKDAKKIQLYIEKYPNGLFDTIANQRIAVLRAAPRSALDRYDGIWRVAQSVSVGAGWNDCTLADDMHVTVDSGRLEGTVTIESGWSNDPLKLTAEVTQSGAIQSGSGWGGERVVEIRGTIERLELHSTSLACVYVMEKAR